MDIEVEVRSFITKDQYDRLLDFFKKNAVLINEDDQETHYFDCEKDIRIQKNQHYAKIWMKAGKMHDDHRKETELKIDKDDFNKLASIFENLGLTTTVKWFRDRKSFHWNDIVVCLDCNKGYGYIFELEQMASEENKDEVLNHLKQKMQELNIPITPKEEFQGAYENYLLNWRELTK